MTINKRKKEFCIRCQDQRFFENLRIEYAKNKNRLLKGNCETCNRINLLPICDWEYLVEGDQHIQDVYAK